MYQVITPLVLETAKAAIAAPVPGPGTPEEWEKTQGGPMPSLTYFKRFTDWSPFDHETGLPLDHEKTLALGRRLAGRDWDVYMVYDRKGQLIATVDQYILHDVTENKHVGKYGVCLEVPGYHYPCVVENQGLRIDGAAFVRSIATGETMTGDLIPWKPFQGFDVEVLGHNKGAHVEVDYGDPARKLKLSCTSPGPFAVRIGEAAWNVDLTLVTRDTLPACMHRITASSALLKNVEVRDEAAPEGVPHVRTIRQFITPDDKSGVRIHLCTCDGVDAKKGERYGTQFFVQDKVGNNLTTARRVTYYNTYGKPAQPTWEMMNGLQDAAWETEKEAGELRKRKTAPPPPAKKQEGMGR